MSYLTICNYCSLKGIEGSAAKKDMVVTQLPNAAHGGIDIYVSPPNVAINSMSPNECNRKYWRAWFMALTDHCSC